MSTGPVLVIGTIVPITSTNGSIYRNKVFVPITSRTRYKCSDNETLVYSVSEQLFAIRYRNVLAIGTYSLSEQFSGTDLYTYESNDL